MKKCFQSDRFLAIIFLTALALTGPACSRYPLANMTRITLVGLTGFLMTLKLQLNQRSGKALSHYRERGT